MTRFSISWSEIWWPGRRKMARYVDFFEMFSIRFLFLTSASTKPYYVYYKVVLSSSKMGLFVFPA
jgi:hypothetical protein